MTDRKLTLHEIALSYMGDKAALVEDCTKRGKHVANRVLREYAERAAQLIEMNEELRKSDKGKRVKRRFDKPIEESLSVLRETM